MKHNLQSILKLLCTLEYLFEALKFFLKHIIKSIYIVKLIIMENFELFV